LSLITRYSLLVTAFGLIRRHLIHHHHGDGVLGGGVEHAGVLQRRLGHGAGAVALDCLFRQQHGRQVDGVLVASVLDGIGDPLKTWQNQMTMEHQGVKPLPCFHYGEDEEYLKWYIEHYPYITLGGMVPISTPQLKLWLDRLWSKYLVDTAGHPKVKIHGFGMTTIDLMKRYPWYSVDSSSWVQIAANGNILVPDFGMVAVSKISPAAKQLGRHIDTIPQLQRETMVKRIESLGFTLERLQNEYVSRWTYNCQAFAVLQRQVTQNTPTFKLAQEVFF